MDNTEKYYRKIHGTICKIIDHRNGPVLLDLIFDRLTDDDIIKLVDYFLKNKEYHLTLKNMNTLLECRNGDKPISCYQCTAKTCSKKYAYLVFFRLWGTGKFHRFSTIN